MKNIIIDTNIVISAAISGGIPAAAILWVVNHRQQFKWIVSQEILQEYKTVLSRPRLKLNNIKQQEWFDLLDDSTQLIEVNIDIDFIRDPKDAKFIACAIVANANYLITGDKDFADAEMLNNTQVVSASMFLTLNNVI